MGNPFSLQGKVAVVTGGNTGIGQGIALALADAGASIASVARAAIVPAAPVAMLTESEDASDAATPQMVLPDKCEGLSSRGCDTQQDDQGNTAMRMYQELRP